MRYEGDLRWPETRRERLVDFVLGRWQLFTHRVVHNGPLWVLCPGCWGLRRMKTDVGETST